MSAQDSRFEAEAKYRALVEQIPGVVYLDPVDVNADSIFVSPQLRDLIGVDPKDWIADHDCWGDHIIRTTSFALGMNTCIRTRTMFR